jgi:hypothetical protein
VTGRSADEWKTVKPSPLNVALPEGVPCPQMATLFTKSQPQTLATPGKVEAAWGAQLVGNSSETAALAAYHQLQKMHATILGAHQPLLIRTQLGRSAFWYRIRVGTNSRASAEKLCSSLRAAGGSCLVQRN